jgi:putative proteasome-type protease
MTYCVGILVQDGLVMIADTRTNAGLDNVAVYRKLHLFERAGDKVMAVATSGNLAVSQLVLTFAREGLVNRDTGETETLLEMPSMFEAARFLGRAIREAGRDDGEAIEQAQPGSFDISVLLGGQVKGGRLRLFLLYPAGNFIEATTDTPYLQIGEHKYGKPILDRAITGETDLSQALKIGLISMDSTMRSNLGVGLPIDLITVRRHSAAVELQYRIDADETYFRDLRERWSAICANAGPRPCATPTRQFQSHPMDRERTQFSNLNWP